jgi:HAD superfamily hydrolase (TIGR01459 family)
MPRWWGLRASARACMADSMNEKPPSIPVLDHAEALSAHYRIWLCDVWGVMHDGLSPFPSAAHACQSHRAGGGIVLLISNSPRPGDGVALQLDQIGVPRDGYDGIVTSGDVCRARLSRRGGERVFLLGPERDRPILDGLDVQLVSPEDAELVLCTGLFDDETETPDDYTELLAGLKAKGLPMICANPDLMVERGNRLIYCAGALAAAYENLGAQVVYTGKPHSPIYDLAEEKLAEWRGAAPARGDILAIGDGLKTDMAGAAARGYDALFVASGLHVAGISAHAPLDAAVVSALFAADDRRPIAAMKRLAW